MDYTKHFNLKHMPPVLLCSNSSKNEYAMCSNCNPGTTFHSIICEHLKKREPKDGLGYCVSSVHVQEI